MRVPRGIDEKLVVYAMNFAGQSFQNKLHKWPFAHRSITEPMPKKPGSCTMKSYESTQLLISAGVRVHLDGFPRRRRARQGLNEVHGRTATASTYQGHLWDPSRWCIDTPPTMSSSDGNQECSISGAAGDSLVSPHLDTPIAI